MSNNMTFTRSLALLATLPLAITACGPGDNGGAGSESGDVETLNIGVHVEPTDWSPSRVQTILFPFTRQIYDSLITYDDDLNAKPSLATEWDINADSDAVTITLRDDVAFHSGEPLTAEAVAANLELFSDPNTGQQLYSPMSVVDDWNVVDERTLEVNFIHPIAELQITDLLQSWTIGDPETLDDETSGEGTGPFKFSEWVSGESIVLERNEEYWGETPAYEELYYRVFGDMNSLVSGFETDVVDVAVDVPTLDAQRLDDGDNTVLEGFPGALIDQWRINPTEEPFDNIHVRQAINYATDREAIVENLYHGYSEPASLPYGASSPAYDDDLAAGLDYDLERAEELLDESGLSENALNGTVKVTSANARTSQAAQILQSSLEEIGFQLDIEVRDNAEYTEDQLNGDFGMMFAALGNGNKFPSRITSNSIYRLEDNPVGAIEQFPDFVPAVEEVNRAVTGDEQDEAFSAMNQVLVDSMWTPTVGYLPTLWLIDPAVSGVARNVDNMLLLADAAPTE